MMSCNPSEFFDKGTRSSSELSSLSLMSKMTEKEFEAAKAGGAAEGSYYAVITGSASYEEFKQKLKERMEQLQFSTYSDYRDTWASSELSDNGLAAYRDCLKNHGGLYATVYHLETATGKAKVGIDWFSGEFGSLDTPMRVVQSDNISRRVVDEIEKALGDEPWNSEDRSKELILRKKDPRRSASIVIGTERSTRVILLPPPIDPIEVPPEVETYAWTARYFEQAPADDNLNIEEKVGGDFIGPIDNEAPTRVSYNLPKTSYAVRKSVENTLGNIPPGTYELGIQYCADRDFDIAVRSSLDLEHVVHLPSTGGKGQAYLRWETTKVRVSTSAPEIILDHGHGFPWISVFLFKKVG